MAPTMHTLLFALAVFALPSCRSVEWDATLDSAGTRWRDYELRQTPRAFVLSRSEDTAEDCYLQVESMIEAAEEVGGVDIPRGLVVAIGRDDPPLFPDGQPMQQMRTLHARSIGKPPSVRGGGSPRVDPQLIAKSIPFGVPLEDRRLGLPASLTRQSAWVLVLPSDACVREVMGEVMDTGMKEKLSFWKRMLIAPFMPFARSTAAKMMRTETIGTAYEVVLHSLGLPEKEQRSLTKRCMVKLGLTREQVVREAMDDPRMKRIEEENQKRPPGEGHDHGSAHDHVPL